MANISIYLTNLGKYNEGELVGEWVHLPVSDEELQVVFNRIGIGSTDEFGQPYEEYFITDYETDIPGLTIDEYENLETLNERAEALQRLDEWDLRVFKNAAEAGFIDFDDLDNFDSSRFILYDGVDTAQELGYAMVELYGGISALSDEALEDNFDFEAYGRDARLQFYAPDMIDVDYDDPEDVARISAQYGVDDIDDITVYDYYGVSDDESLGRLLTEDVFNIPDEAKNSRTRKIIQDLCESYFDYANYAQGMINAGVGEFTSDGFIEDTTR